MTDCAALVSELYDACFERESALAADQDSADLTIRNELQKSAQSISFRLVSGLEEHELNNAEKATSDSSNYLHSDYDKNRLLMISRRLWEVYKKTNEIGY